MGLIRVKEPKTRWKSARQQTVIIDDPCVIDYLRWRKDGIASLSEKVWPHSPALWQKRFLLLQKHLDLPHHYTAACLRAWSDGLLPPLLQHRQVED